MKKLSVFLFTAATASAALPVAEIKRDTPVDFSKEIYPVLKRNCLACHNATKAKAGLNLETPELILKGGDTGPSAVPGKSADSLLLKTAMHAEDPAMPPPGNKVNAANLTAEELGLLRRWIDEGAKGTAPAQEKGIVWRGIPGHTSPVNSVAVSPGGTVAAGARGNAVTLFDMATGVSLGSLADPALAKLEMYKDQAVADRDAVMSVAFASEDLMATGGYRTARLWRRAPFTGGKNGAQLPDVPLSLAAADRLAASGDSAGRVLFWNPAEEKPPVTELKDGTAPVSALAISPDASLIVAVSQDRAARVWSVAEKKVLFRGESPVAVSSLCFLKEGTVLAAAGVDGMLRLYPFSKDAPVDLAKPAKEIRLSDKAPAFFTRVPGAGANVLWGAGDAVLHLVDTEAGKNVRDITCESPAVRGIAKAERLLQNARRLVDARKARATAATEAANKEAEGVKTAHGTMQTTRAAWQRKLAESTAATEALRQFPDDGPRKEAAAKTAKETTAAERAFLNARTNAELSVRLAAQAGQARLAADGAFAAAQTTLTEAQADVDTAKAPVPFPVVKSAVVLADGLTVAISLEGGRVQWHALESGALCDAASTTAGPLLAVSGDQLLGAGPDKKAVPFPQRRVWQWERTLGDPEDAAVFSGRVTALSFSSDGRLLAAGGGIPSRAGEVKIWNVVDGTPVLTLKDPHSDTVNALAFSPDDSLLATAGSDRWARVFRVADGERTASFEGHSSHVLSIAWRGDGLALATGGADNTLRVWDLLDAKPLRAATTFPREVSAVTWMGTGDTIASASGDSTVRLNEERLPGTKGFVFSLAADLSGTWLAAGGEDGIVRVWNAAGKKLIQEHGPR